jgi:ubiquinone/menaquinone biosynthesis C-methylase UbiE
LAELLASDLHTLSARQWADIIVAGYKAGLRLRKFKRTMGLARVQKVLGLLNGIAPNSLLDVGSGRGAFLWPLLDQFPELTVVAIDQSKQRASDLEAVHLGGVSRLTAFRKDLTSLDFHEAQFDVVTTLEVLEHIPNYEAAIQEAVRVAQRFVIASVPSKPDDNPEHLHVLTRDQLQAAFDLAGARRVRFDSVLNHLIVVASVDR